MPSPPSPDLSCSSIHSIVSSSSGVRLSMSFVKSQVAAPFGQFVEITIQYSTLFHLQLYFYFYEASNWFRLRPLCDLAIWCTQRKRLSGHPLPSCFHLLCNQGNQDLGFGSVGPGFLHHFQGPILLKSSCDGDFLLLVLVGEFAVGKLIDLTSED